MSRTQRRRRVDASDPLDRLTAEQRADVFLRRLSSDVSRACDWFFRNRKMPIGREAFQQTKPESKP